MTQGASMEGHYAPVANGDFCRISLLNNGPYPQKSYNFKISTLWRALLLSTVWMFPSPTKVCRVSLLQCWSTSCLSCYVLSHQVRSVTSHTYVQSYIQSYIHSYMHACNKLCLSMSKLDFHIKVFYLVSGFTPPIVSPIR